MTRGAYLSILSISVLLLLTPPALNLYESVALNDWRASTRFDGQAYILSTSFSSSVEPAPAHEDATGVAAVLSTLSSWNGTQTTPAEVFERMSASSFAGRLSDVTQLSASYGLDGQWLQAEPAALSHIKTPFVAHMEDDGGRFVIVRDVRGGYVYAADPTRGQVLYPFENFTAAWAGHILAFSDPPAQPEEWR